MKRIIFTIRKNQIAIVFLLGITGLFHAYNMFGYPAFFDDEGTYMAQAWSVLTQGKLAPYTYWYDHSPVGWLFLSVWMGLTGGAYTFGPSIQSGRIFMLVLKLLSTYFLYAITTKLSGKTRLGLVAGLLFAVSPLAVSLHRMVFLDNIAVFWLLWSIVMLLEKQFSQKKVIVSGALLALSILTKESLLFFIPAFWITLWFYAHQKQRVFSLSVFTVVVVSLLSLYPVFALLKGELFPQGSVLSPGGNHVSLITTLVWQSARKGGFFLSPESEFFYTVKTSWLPADGLLLSTGVISAIGITILGIRKKQYTVAAAFFWFYVLYLIRGGIINDQYLIPLLPFLVLCFVLAFDWLQSVFVRIGLPRVAKTIVVCIGGIFGSFYMAKLDPYFLNQTYSQRKAVDWVNTQIPKNAVVAVDGFAIPDVFVPGTQDVYANRGAHHYWKIDQDPQLKNKLVGDSWKPIDYLLVTNKFERDQVLGQLPLVSAAQRNADLVFAEPNPRSWYEDIKPYGYWFGHILLADSSPARIYQRRPVEEIALSESWSYYKNNFIRSYGQIVDPQQNRTTSEGQAYALLRAVWMDDKHTFDGVWGWTNDHLRWRPHDSLLSWLWLGDDVTGKLGDWMTAPDADTDTALALLFAYKKWGSDEYLREAKRMLADIWHVQTATIPQGRVITGGDWAVGQTITVNPSYMAPYAYRIFAQVDTERDWNAVVAGAYHVLAVCKTSFGLPTDWCQLAANGQVVSLVAPDGKSHYAYDAYRVWWRVVLDYQWFGDTRAKDYLNAVSFLTTVWLKDKGLSAGYTSAGEQLSGESLSQYALLLPVYQILNQSLYNELYATKIDTRYKSNDTEGYWGEKTNYYDQNMVWFGLATALGKLPNLWSDGLLVSDK